METYRTILQSALLKKSQENPLYGLRAFAKKLGIGPGALSEIMSGKRGLSVKKAMLICDKAGMSLEENDLFIQSVKSTKAIYKRRKTDEVIHAEVQQLNLDTFQVISEWYHFAILSLAKIQGAKADSRWIASRLRITSIEAKTALARLERLGLIEIVDGRMVRQAVSLKTPTDTPSRHIRKFHTDLLAKGQVALEEVDLSLRDVTSSILVIDPKDLPLAKEEIKKFKKKFSQKIEKKNPKEVYALTISLIPISEVQK